MPKKILSAYEAISIKEAFFQEKEILPTITIWNRLEGRPRSNNFERALRAEIRDPLWMLSRQWQMGEFKGDDAGSAILAKAQIRQDSFTKYQPGSGGVKSFDRTTPLEVQVENQHIPFIEGNQEISLDIRLLMGRQWFKLIKRLDPDGVLKNDYIAHPNYKFTQPTPSNKEDAKICAHIKTWQHFAAIANRYIDGYALYEYLKEGGNASDGLAISGNLRTQLNRLGNRFISWYEGLFYQPPRKTENPSWQPSSLEHQFSCSSTTEKGEKVYCAQEYFHGYLDWYNLDIDPIKKKLEMDEDIPRQGDETSTTLSFFPGPISFPGMPNARWWEFEDREISLNDLPQSTKDIHKLLVLDFWLSYANDWFLLPVTVPVGSIIELEGLMITDVFGDKFWIEAAGKGLDKDWNRWGVFNTNIKGDRNIPVDLSITLLPTVPKVMEGKPIEEVYFLRDEVANMVWGVETIVPVPDGKGHPGREVSFEYRKWLEGLKEKVENQSADQEEANSVIENEAKITYQLVNTVPENWIPFIAVHSDSDRRQIQLQRAAMPRIFKGDDNPPEKIEPRTSLLRYGLNADEGEDYLPYFLNEEEIPRSGVKVQKAFQRTRWVNGKVFTWLGIKKETGRGEGHSGLAFDQLIPKK